MSTTDARSVFKHTLAWLEQNNLPVSKIALQKALFFLQEKGVSMGLDFEPHSYGPFSRQIMEIASDLERNNQVVVERTSYQRGPEFTDELNQDRQIIDTGLEEFSSLLAGDFSFNNLELYGTVLYCIQALQENGLPADKNAAIQEFRAWKGNKYPQESISRAYDALAKDFVVAKRG